MLISMRDTKGKLVVKDVLDVDYDMSIREGKNSDGKDCYEIWINKKYRYSDTFESESDAEKMMLDLATARNDLENDLRNY